MLPRLQINCDCIDDSGKLIKETSQCSDAGLAENPMEDWQVLVRVNTLVFLKDSLDKRQTNRMQFHG